jgi:hypothetical protein
VNELPSKRASPSHVPIQRKPFESWKIVAMCSCGNPSLTLHDRIGSS